MIAAASQIRKTLVGVPIGGDNRQSAEVHVEYVPLAPEERRYSKI